ncbi:glyoxalase/bleomycin resistance/dioxygenase family protein [Streptomyces sp. NPDC092296]|uniref:glyoxalase/bleomycin resistance/dioxygenase family protein n=1 Tax=Streptomyces sp. NPDC092296 TaxID=3366012 RepID=UPI0038079953
MIRTDLIVLYTDHLDACRAFYTSLGMDFAKERHGAGPEHYAATLHSGTVFEIYPATSRRPATGSLRLGYTTTQDATLPPLAPGRHILTDPDGRTIALHVQETPVTPEQNAQETIRNVFGDTLQSTDIRAFDSGALAITLAAAGHTASIDGSDAAGWGLTVDGQPHQGFTAHDRTAATLQEALETVRAAFATGR